MRMRFIIKKIYQIICYKDNDFTSNEMNVILEHLAFAAGAR